MVGPGGEEVQLSVVSRFKSARGEEGTLGGFGSLTDMNMNMDMEMNMDDGDGDPDPDYVTCDLCGGAGWVPAFVVRRDWVRGKGKGKG